jgi:hypothetical protein
MPTKPRIKKKAPKITTDKDVKTVMEAIKGSAGIVSTIAKRMGVEWHTANERIQRYPEALAAFADEREGILDMAEATIFTAIKSGDTGSAKWILSTIGRKRGFTEKQEIEISGEIGTPVKFVFVDPPKKHADTE